MPVPDPLLLVFAALALAALAAVMAGLIDRWGAVAGFCCGLFIFMGGGMPLLAVLGVFFITGSLATAWNMRKKAALGLAQENKGRRTATNVLANGGVAAVLGVLAWAWPPGALPLQLMIAASLASATSDTLSSELGNVYGSRYFRILGFQAGERGRDGVVSPEGTAAGAMGSFLAAAVYSLPVDGGASIIWVGLAGLFGNLTDSILGGSLQHRGYLDNHSVNFFSTLAAAGAIGAGWWCWANF